MDKYRRVERPKEVHEDVKEKREVHVTSQGKMRNYISYTLSLFEEDSTKPVTLKAMGRAINKTVTIVEITKRRIVDTTVGSVDVKDTWEPLEEGLDVVVTSRHVSTISVVLSLQPLNTNSPGYQPPLPADQVQPEKANKIVMEDEAPAVPLPAAAGAVPAPGARGRGRGAAGAGGAPPEAAIRGGAPRGRGGARGGQGPPRGGPRLRGARGGPRTRGPRRGGGAPPPPAAAQH